MIIEKHVVPENINSTRFSDYIYNNFLEYFSSKKSIKKSILSGEFTLNNITANTGDWVNSNDLIEYNEKRVINKKIFNLKFDVIFEDEYFAVINKPAGYPVSGNQFNTIQNALLNNIVKSDEKDSLLMPKPVHRLDSSTCGLLVIAKTRRSLVSLGNQFEKKIIKKKYRAVVINKIPAKGLIKNSIGELEALTEFKRLTEVPSKKFNFLSLVDLWPATGRTHQLRIHMASMGAPILGDRLYGWDDKILKGRGLFLCASELILLHPISNEQLKFKTKEPAKFNLILEKENRRFFK